MSAPIAEIGVYHGKFFIGLHKINGVSSGNFAIDVFDMQEFNLDGAGKGNLEKFKRNISICGIESSSVNVLKLDSMAINSKDIEYIRDKSGGFSFFSVDGCHMVEHTINDIKIAAELTDPRGVIIVDDYYNASWPGVQEGVSRLYILEGCKFVPFIYSANKLFLVHISYHRQYLSYLKDALLKRFPSVKTKSVMRFGYESLNVIAPHDEILAILGQDGRKTAAV